MTYQPRRIRFGGALDSLRWLLLSAPLFTLIGRLTPSTWPLVVLGLVSSLPVIRLPARPGWLLPAALAATATASAALWMLMPSNLASAAMFAAVFYAVRFLSGRQATAIVSIAVAVIGTVFALSQEHVLGTLLNLALLTAVVLGAVHRHDRQARVEQTELALARAQAVAEERTVAAALAERARIARELHDVLAHSLSGLALNLQSARLMLLRDGASEESVGQVERAQRLANDGIAEARKAVAALRDDPVSLDRAIDDLLTGYRLDTSAPAKLAIQGSPREIGTAAGATVLRAVQESLTNTRKHAPGAPVEVTLTYSRALVEVTVLDHQNGPVPKGTAGYGLRGMRERAELLGGSLSTGPGEDGWRVHLTVPA
ncbi:sensor histidine kinase [Amycolatopsis taiwanensis]|uniref:sensor histidine kinase n=1 Tax=Amycolatopsis taiwanensis TaxID=342230 RepID=UPI0004B087FC|nr:histidine kinase [Amycolatopsis taiwanensis]